MAFVLCCGMLLPQPLYSPVLEAQAEEENVTFVQDGLVYSLQDDLAVLEGCEDKSVTAVSIPAQIEGRPVGFVQAAFRDCPNLQRIDAAEESTLLCSVDGVLFTKAMGTLLEYPAAKSGTYIIPAETAQIARSAFAYCTGLTSVTLHENVALYGKCFQYCKNLEEVIGTARMEQGHDFVGCSKLRSLTVGNCHVSELIFQNMDALTELTFAQDCSFSRLQVLGCPSLTSLTVDGMVHSLHESEVTMEITGCPSLQTLTLQPDVSVSSAPYRAYVGTVAAVSDCGLLEEIVCQYPGDIQLKDCPSLRTLRRYSGTRHTTISGCDALETVYGLADDTQLQQECASLGTEFIAENNTSYTIQSQDGLEYTLHSANDGTCWYLTNADPDIISVYIPAMIGGIPVAASSSVFNECTAITAFEAAPENTMLCSVDGVLFSKDMTALLRCPNLWDGAYTIPDGVTNAENAFKNCKWLTSLTIPDSVTGDMGTFDGCDSLKEISGAFYVGSGLHLDHCPRLKDVHIAASDEIIDPGFGFLLCDGNETLEHLTIGKNCIMDGEFRFRWCTALETLDFTRCTADGRLSELIISDCDALTSVSLPPVTGEKWASAEISECSALRTLKVYGNWRILKQGDFHPDAVIYAYEDNSNIRSLCEQTGIPFIPFGDVKADGSLDILDVLQLNKNLLSGEKLDEKGQNAADIDADGRLTSADALQILRTTIGL